MHLEATRYFLLSTFDTLLRKILQLSAMFRSLKFRHWSLMISRYLVMFLNLVIKYLHWLVHIYFIRNICNSIYKIVTIELRAWNDGSDTPESMLRITEMVALKFRNSGSQNPDRWLNMSRNIHIYHLSTVLWARNYDD